MPSEALRHPPILGFRLGLWYGGFFVVGTLFLLALSYTLLAWSLRTRDHELVRLTLADYAALYEGGGLDGLRAGLLTEQRIARAPDLFVRVVGPGGEAIFLSSPRRWAPFDLGRLLSPMSTHEPTWSTLPARNDNAALEVAHLRFDDGTLLEVGISTKERFDTLSRFRRQLLLVALLTLAIGVGGGVLVTRWTLRPIRDLTRTATAIVQTGALGSRVPVRPTGETLDDLARLVNAMLDRIERLVAGIREALDNVAHDLRTPLMRVRAIAESAAESSPPGACRDALGGVLEETDQVSSTLDSLMDIAEAERGAMRLDRRVVPVMPIIADAVALYADLADERGVAIEASGGETLTAFVDRARTRQVLANLIDNAVKYTPGGGRVGVSASLEDGQVCLVVSDTGPGISADDLPRVWDRLYRGDQSRSERGLGLGLSLVKAIVEAHGGRVGVTSDPGHGARFTVWLPSTPPPAR
jgi:signal transduction histidine kinase